MKTITLSIINSTIEEAKASPRKRAHYLLHNYEDPIQRMVNAILPGSYVPPHRHSDPAKFELFCILKGSIGCLKFDDAGNVTHAYHLQESGPVKIVDIVPGEYHSFVAFEPSALLEIVQGPYDPLTHKDWPNWSPKEDDPQAAAYYQSLVKSAKALLTLT